MPATAPGPDLAALRARGAATIKTERDVSVEILGQGSERVVVKTYRNHGLRWWQTFGRRSRARREFDNLSAAAKTGLPLTTPLHWQQRRQFGLFVKSSTLVTRYCDGTKNLKAVLAELPPNDPARRALAPAIGGVLRTLHDAGVLWATPMPRNLLLRGSPEQAQLLLCDLPAAVVYKGPVPARTACIDLYDALFSPSRQRDFSRSQRLLGLCAYAGDRRRARQLWSQLHSRSRTSHRLHKNLVMGLRTYILLPLQSALSKRPTTQDAHS